MQDTSDRHDTHPKSTLIVTVCNPRYQTWDMHTVWAVAVVEIAGPGAKDLCRPII